MEGADLTQMRHEPRERLLNPVDRISEILFGLIMAVTIVGSLSVATAGTAEVRTVMLAALGTMIVAAAELAAWKALPGLLLGRLLTGAAVGLAAGTAITYLIELRLRADPNASPGLARTIGTSVNVGALGIGPLVAGCLAAWASRPLTLPYLVWIALGAAVTRTRALFDAGRPICDAVRGRLGYELRATWLGGVRMLHRVERLQLDVFRKRPTLGPLDAPWIAWRLLTWPGVR